MPVYQVVEENGKKRLDSVQSCCAESQQLLDAAEDALAQAEEAVTKAEEAASNVGSGGSSLVAVPSLTLGDALVVGSTNTFTASAQSYLDGVTITKFVLDVPALGISKQEFAAINGMAEISIAVPESTAPDTQLLVSVYAVDSLGNRSVAANKSVNVVAVSLGTPNIVSPAAGSTVTVGGKSITVMGSDFTVALGTDTHESTDWQLMRSGVVIAEALNSSDLTTHTFLNLTLVNGETLSVRCRYKGAKGGYSEWSGAVSFSVLLVNIVVEGRSVYRHPTEPGVVASWHDVGIGQQINLLVFDAVKRLANVKWTSLTTNIPDSSLPNLQSQNTNSTWFIDGTNASVQQSTAAQLTEAQLNALWPASVIDPNTAKHNCSVWESMGLTSYPALAHARTVLTADGQKADIPNIQELMRIFCLAAAIDALDPTVASYPSLALMGWFNNSWAWASSEYGSGDMRCVTYSGDCPNGTKTLAAVVVPVLEITG